MVHISESHFVGSGIKVVSDKTYCNAWIDLQSITVQNCTPHVPLLVRNMISIKLENIRFIYNPKGIAVPIVAVAVGQRFGTVPFTVQSRFTSVNSSSHPQMKPLQGTQRVRGICTKLTYTILSRHLKDTEC